MSRTRRVIQLIGRRASGQLGLPKRLPVFQTANSASSPFTYFWRRRSKKRLAVDRDFWKKGKSGWRDIVDQPELPRFSHSPEMLVTWKLNQLNFLKLACMDPKLYKTERKPLIASRWQLSWSCPLCGTPAVRTLPASSRQRRTWNSGRYGWSNWLAENWLESKGGRYLTVKLKLKKKKVS